ncbi:hypothetical protein K378_01396 [Streptomyces sp. Amel2xB2]|uniref:hypothetical protein n=1 Tax=Streptomyces sp. Amel2xB2 TaxID=1305829 RepID=UPI000DBF8475|nr:hypothetical protein [Streptomyces sp. Amel2xB2]RAJ70231.1 hypothetical protein K378_01396 [Streptomyces sp. Amel2xB2]
MTVPTQLDAMSLVEPAAGFFETDVQAANAICTEWDHYLGPCNRPYGMQAWRLDVAGMPISVAISASTFSSTVAERTRGEVVELARLCTRPDYKWATRVMLRLWREIGAQAWPYWDVTAAVAYSGNKRHPGHIYRHDGWIKVTDRAGAPSGPNATWSKHRDAEHAASGRKTLWLWNYAAAQAPGQEVAA